MTSQSLFPDSTLCGPACQDALPAQPSTLPYYGVAQVTRLLVLVNNMPQAATSGFKIPLCNLPIEELIALVGAAMDPCCPQTNTTLAEILLELKKPVDNEMIVLCNAAGESVLVQYDTTVIPPVIAFQWNMVTQAEEPAGSVLTKCPVAQAIETSPLKACLAGASIPGIAVLNDAVPPAVIAELWRDPVTGLYGPLPTGAVIGDCPPAAVDKRKVLTWLREDTAAFGVPDIVGAVGTDQIQSITVVNTGASDATITDDFGNTTKLHPGQSWSWSAITGADAWDILGASSVAFDPSGSVLQTTALVIP